MAFFPKNFMFFEFFDIYFILLSITIYETYTNKFYNYLVLICRCTANSLKWRLVLLWFIGKFVHLRKRMTFYIKYI